MSITIPIGTHFQFRSYGSVLKIVGVTVPPPPREDIPVDDDAVESGGFFSCEQRDGGGDQVISMVLGNGVPSIF